MHVCKNSKVSQSVRHMDRIFDTIALFQYAQNVHGRKITQCYNIARIRKHHDSIATLHKNERKRMKFGGNLS